MYLLGYGEDEFGYQLWDLIDKKVIRSQDIVFMEDKTMADWAGSRMLAKELSGPVGFGQGARSADREPEA